MVVQLGLAIIRRGAQHHPVLPQPSGDQHAAVSQSAIAHRHIKPFFHEIHDAVAEGHFKLKPGMLLRQLY